MVLLGYFNLGGGEVILLLALVLILFGSGNIPRVAKWLWGDDAREAGRSFGGIYGKGGFQALTPDNKVAELYKPSLHKDPKIPKRPNRITRRLLALWARIRIRVNGEWVAFLRRLLE